mmetsp:Transcript_13587/g.24586  ORF Transcript_13587/g.24586 Transcript_13587/m.24586 type:complete len:244 (-) Transcript_13587:837-1568(-)
MLLHRRGPLDEPLQFPTDALRSLLPTLHSLRPHRVAPPPLGDIHLLHGSVHLRDRHAELVTKHRPPNACRNHHLDLIARRPLVQLVIIQVDRRVLVKTPTDRERNARRHAGVVPGDAFVFPNVYGGELASPRLRLVDFTRVPLGGRRRIDGEAVGRARRYKRARVLDDAFHPRSVLHATLRTLVAARASAVVYVRESGMHRVFQGAAALVLRRVLFLSLDFFEHLASVPVGCGIVIFGRRGLC